MRAPTIARAESCKRRATDLVNTMPACNTEDTKSGGAAGQPTRVKHFLYYALSWKGGEIDNCGERGDPRHD